MNWTGILLIRLPLALWVGGALAAGAFVAPTLFRMLPSRTQAGDLFGAVVKRLEGLLHLLSAVLVVGIFQQVSALGRIEGRSAIAALAVFLAIATNVYNSMVVRPRMAYYRAQVPSFDAAPENDPWRSRFKALHRRAQRVMTFGLVCALVALVAAP